MYYKAKSYIKASTSQRKMNISKILDYLDKDETRLEAIEPTQETLREINPRKLTIVTKFLNLRLQSRETFKNSRDKAKVYLAGA